MSSVGSILSLTRRSAQNRSIGIYPPVGESRNVAGPGRRAAPVVPVEDVEALQADLRPLCEEAEVFGTLLVAPEGINGTIAGSEAGVRHVLSTLRADPRFMDLEHKESWTDKIPFRSMRVRLKKEIVALKVPGIDPREKVGTYVQPKDWNALIDRPDVVVIDTRNTYEIELGTFEGSMDPQTRTFGKFPEWLKQQTHLTPDTPIAMFCTGGIRCEKATSYLMEQGFEQVYHLQGGILKYLEEVPKPTVAGRRMLCLRLPSHRGPRLEARAVRFMSRMWRRRTSGTRGRRAAPLSPLRARPAMSPILYSFRRCPYAMRARHALYISQQRCELREVVLRDKPPSMLEYSPKGTVPVLVLPSGPVIEESLESCTGPCNNPTPKAGCGHRTPSPMRFKGSSIGTTATSSITWTDTSTRRGTKERMPKVTETRRSVFSPPSMNASLSKIFFSATR